MPVRWDLSSVEDPKQAGVGSTSRAWRQGRPKVLRRIKKAASPPPTVSIPSLPEILSLMSPFGVKALLPCCESPLGQYLTCYQPPVRNGHRRPDSTTGRPGGRRSPREEAPRALPWKPRVLILSSHQKHKEGLPTPPSPPKLLQWVQGRPEASHFEHVPKGWPPPLGATGLKLNRRKAKRSSVWTPWSRQWPGPLLSHPLILPKRDTSGSLTHTDHEDLRNPLALSQQFTVGGGEWDPEGTLRRTWTGNHGGTR